MRSEEDGIHSAICIEREVERSAYHARRESNEEENKRGREKGDRRRAVAIRAGARRQRLCGDLRHALVSGAGKAKVSVIGQHRLIAAPI